MAEKPNPLKTAANDTSRAIAAMHIEKVVGKAAGEVAGKTAGILVEPAYWLITGKKPDAMDVTLVGVGAFGGPIGLVSSVITGIIKDIADDQEEFLLAAVKTCEPKRYSSGIKPTSKYSGLAGSYINAGTIASQGGTAWLHPNGLWVYIVDGKGRLVADYTPAKAKQVFQPTLPLVPVLNGYQWHMM